MQKLTHIFAIMMLLAISSSLRAADAVPSTPAEALSSFIKAMDAGDTATLAAISAGDEREQAWLAAYASHLKAFAGLEQALAKKYGKDYAQEDAGVSIGEQIESGKDDELSKDLRHAKLVELNADSVMIEFTEGASPDTQGKLVKADGKWKVQIESLGSYFSTDDTAGVKAMTDAANGLARDVGTGKFAKLEDAAAAVEERLTAAEGVGAKKLPDPPGGKSSVKVKRP